MAMIRTGVHTPEEIAQTLKSHLREENCQQLLDSCEALMQLVWDYNCRLLGHTGTSAVFNRALSLASDGTPALRKLKVDEQGIDFAAFRSHVIENRCAVPETLDTLSVLGATVFQVISDLTADVVITPLLRYLEEKS